MKLLKGSIIHAPALETLETIENGALLLDDDGTIREVLHEAPADFDGRVYDCSGQLIMQSFADMHLHAPQFPNVGMGMDLPLLDWLKTYILPWSRRSSPTSTTPAAFIAVWRTTLSRTAPRACACFPRCTRTRPSC